MSVPIQVLFALAALTSLQSLSLSQRATTLVTVFTVLTSCLDFFSPQVCQIHSLAN